MARQFVIVTKDFSGLGWAKKLTEEGETVTVATKFEAEEDPKLRKMMKREGEGWLRVVELADAIRLCSSPSTYWIFAENNFPEDADRLRDKGQKVFGTSALSERMEHDRKYAVDVATKAGLKSPETHEFTTLQEGLDLLDANTDKAYVFKPDDSQYNYMTFVPVRAKDEDANRELYTFLKHQKEPGSYIMQERIAQEEALEVCVEAWIYEGEPFLAFLGLEVKRKNTYDIGEMTGCGGDYSKKIPLDCELVKISLGKMFDFYREQKYTGFADVNVILTKDNKPHFLEVCNRFGYNSHPNLFLALAKDGFGDLLADFVDGRIDDMESRFRSGFGCSVTLFNDHPMDGMPIHVGEWTAEQFYPFDGRKEGEDDILLQTGYSDEIGIFVDYAETMEAAWDRVWNKIVFDEAVSVPGMYYRTDIGKDDYYNAPTLRYKELVKRGLL